MADWTDIDTNGLLPGEPVTSALMLALEENPRGLADQASGAPKIADKVVYASGTTVTFSNLDDFSGLFFELSSAGEDLEMDVSTDSGSSFGSNFTLRVNNASSTDDIAFLRGYLNFSDGQVYAVGFAIYTDTGGGGQIRLGLGVSGTVPGAGSNITDVRFFSDEAVNALVVPQGGQSAV